MSPEIINPHLSEQIKPVESKVLLTSSNHLFISDIHGRDPNLENQLNQIIESGKNNQQDRPEIVFFLGDIVGTDSLAKLQKLFYDVYNPAKKLLQDNPQATDNQILGLTNKDENITQLHQLLWDFIYQTKGSSNLTDKFRTDHIRQLVTYSHFGHFTSNLPDSVKNRLKNDMEENAQIWLDIMNKFVENGSLVAVIEGNWDARTPLDFCPTPECQELPLDQRLFSLRKFLSEQKNHNIVYFDETGVIETENEIFVLCPFDSSVAGPKNPNLDPTDNRQVILVSHAQIDWKSVKGDTAMTKESQTIQANMKPFLEDIKAKTAIHGHLHDQIDSETYQVSNCTVQYLPKGHHRVINFQKS